VNYLFSERIKTLFTPLPHTSHKQKNPLRVGFIVDEIGNFRVELKEV